MFTDARGLTTEQMQALARETNLAETSSSCPASPRSSASAACRCASSPHRKSWSSPAIPRWAPQLALLEPPRAAWGRGDYARPACGADPGALRPADAAQGGVFGTMQQNDPVFGAVHDPRAVAAAIGLASRTSIRRCRSRPSPPAWPSALCRCVPWRSLRGCASRR